MATRNYGINLGDDAKFVTEGAAGTGKDIEVVIADTSKPWRKEDVKILLEKIIRHVLDNKTYPGK